MKLHVPGFVYNECLDPKTTSVPKESGWPEPTWRQYGRGYRYTYDVDAATAADIVAWVREFGEGISFGVDDASVGRRLVRWAEGAPV